MPKYQYKCKDCTNIFSLYHNINDNEQLCIKCNSKNIQKIYNINKILSETPVKNINIGEETRRVIEENTQVLESMKNQELEFKG